MLSGFISGSEIAYFALTPSQCEELEETSRGRAVMRLLEVPERLLATILIANNLVNVSIVVLLNFALGPVFSNMSPLLSFILQTVILTFLILLFGEILPKLYANTDSVKWALAAAPGLTLISRLLNPLSWMLVKSSGVVNRVVVKKTENLTADDLSQALELTDVQANDDKEMLEGILRFGDTTASEIMTPRVDMTDIDIELTFEEVMKVVVESGYARIPVIDGSEDNIKGVLYARDLLPYVGATDVDHTFDWRTLLRPAYFVPESRMIDDLLEDFRSRRIHMAVVIDEYGCTQGVVTLEDVLEEIVGDINDEYDEEEKTWRQLPDDTYIFEGRTLLTDFFRVTNLNEEEYEAVADDCETLAGMLLAIKGDFPKEKESLVYGRCRFLVLDIEHHRITSVRVKVMPDEQTA
ncbi:MAG: gliding motility-associated protein GldE [Bacteroides sp.]|nr:gliding motility-associated protein GldE [Bacteroides sp.]MBD5377865.1 gliding motility-associated protein GldE [Bacteroides sp.]